MPLIVWLGSPILIWMLWSRWPFDLFVVVSKVSGAFVGLSTVMFEISYFWSFDLSSAQTSRVIRLR